jgi:hypothetical protein
MSQILQRGIDTLINNGLVELLVFSLIFALVYGILQSIKIFGEEEETKKYNLLIAICFGALAIIPHYIAPGSNYDVVPFLTKALPQTMLVAVGILGLLILLGMLGLHDYISKDGSKWSWVVGLVLLAVVVYIFVGSSGFVWGLPYWLTPDLIAVIVAVAVFVLIIGFVMGGDDKPNNPAKPT